jgi:hypothetical protein
LTDGAKALTLALTLEAIRDSNPIAIRGKGKKPRSSRTRGAMALVMRVVSLACALALIGVGSYLLVDIVVRHEGFGRLGLVAPVMIVLGEYLLWVELPKD